MREERLVAADGAHFHREDRGRKACEHELAHRCECVATTPVRDEVLELVEIRLVHHRIDHVRRPDAPVERVRVRDRLVDVVVDLHVTPVGQRLAGARKPVELRGVVGRHPEERVVAV